MLLRTVPQPLQLEHDLFFSYFTSHTLFLFLLWGHLIADMDLSVCNRVWFPFEIYIAWQFDRRIFPIFCCNVYFEKYLIKKTDLLLGLDIRYIYQRDDRH